MKKLLFIITVITIIEGVYSSTFPQDSPYPQSSKIKNVSWDYSSLTRKAAGCDLFPITWADDDNLYTIWGDGSGFDGLSRASWGVARLSGLPTSFYADDIYGNGESFPGEGGKCDGGIIYINGILYAYIQKQNEWDRCYLWQSTDYGVTWTNEGEIFKENELFVAPAIVTFGKNYDGARDEYVYLYSNDSLNIYLARVNKDSLKFRSAYEFFNGTLNNLSWSNNISDITHVFTDQNGVLWGFNCFYHPQTQRYIITVRHNETSGWGIFDAPEPWGPWTTVIYYENWIDPIKKTTFVFNQKWMSDAGDTLWMVFAGREIYDSFNTIKCILNFDISVPVELTSLAASVSGDNVTLKWSVASELNNRGFEIERSSIIGQSLDNWNIIGFVKGTGTSTQIRNYSFIDSAVPNGKYLYRLKQYDFDGSFRYFTFQEVKVNFFQNEFQLNQNYPNPFNPSTAISFYIDKDQFSEIHIFDVLGQKVKTVLSEFIKAGYHEIPIDMKELKSGVYIYQLLTETNSALKKMLLLN